MRKRMVNQQMYDRRAAGQDGPISNLLTSNPQELINTAKRNAPQMYYNNVDLLANRLGNASKNNLLRSNPAENMNPQVIVPVLSYVQLKKNGNTRFFKFGALPRV